jgi:two-component system sensor histidine kinase PhoQ
VDIPENLNMQSPTVTLIYDAKGKLLWMQRDVAWLAKRIQPEWLKSNGFHEIESDVDSSMLLRNNQQFQEELDALRQQDDGSEMTHSVAINIYPAPADAAAEHRGDRHSVELKRSYMVWSWFIYVLVANLLLVIPLLWVAAWWSLRPIESLAKEVRELEEHHREMLNPNTTRELTRLVSNLAGF